MENGKARTAEQFDRDQLTEMIISCGLAGNGPGNGLPDNVQRIRDSCRQDHPGLPISQEKAKEIPGNKATCPQTPIP